MSSKKNEITYLELLDILRSGNVYKFDIHYKIFDGKRKTLHYLSESKMLMSDFLINAKKERYGSTWVSLYLDEITHRYYKLIH